MYSYITCALSGDGISVCIHLLSFLAPVQVQIPDLNRHNYSACVSAFMTFQVKIFVCIFQKSN